MGQSCFLQAKHFIARIAVFKVRHSALQERAEVGTISLEHMQRDNRVWRHCTSAYSSSKSLIDCWYLLIGGWYFRRCIDVWRKLLTAQFIVLYWATCCYKFCAPVIWHVANSLAWLLQIATCFWELRMIVTLCWHRFQQQSSQITCQSLKQVTSKPDDSHETLSYCKIRNCMSGFEAGNQ